MNTSTLAYPQDHSSRDLRIDFLRGLVMVGLVIIHMEYYSFFSMFVWGRIGLVSTAEGFVLLSGLVIGRVYAGKMEQNGFLSPAKKLWRRAFQLYRVNLFVIFSIAILYFVPIISTFDLMHWSVPQDAPGLGMTFWLYPQENATFFEWIIQTLLLQIGPHQFQVIGLYVVLVAIAPFTLWLMKNKQTHWLLIFSWALYFYQTQHPIKFSQMRFEYGFPISAWQLLFFNGMAIGVHHDFFQKLMTERRQQILFYFSTLGVVLFIFLALNRPQPLFWPGPTLSMISADNFHWLYDIAFQKTSLGIGRLFNNFFLLIFLYLLLTRYWIVIHKVLGWFFVPLGQASLYVFILHIYLILIISNSSLLNYENFWVNSMIHLASLALIWWMVKRKVFYSFIPR